MDAELLSKKSSCGVAAEQGALQDWTKHRLTAAEVHTLTQARLQDTEQREKTPITGCRCASEAGCKQLL